MINHLKEIHRKLYLPPATSPPKPHFKVEPIDEPYLYTEANLYINTFDNPDQSVKVIVSNIGGGKLKVERIHIPRDFGMWVKRKKKSKPALLTTKSNPLEVELKVLLKELPNPSTVSVAALNLISNSRSKTFSKVLLGVRSPEDQSPSVTVPEYIKFEELTVWHISLTDNRKDETTQPVQFSLVGDFQGNPPKQLEIKQKDESSFDVCFLLQKGKLDYKLDLRTPGTVRPRQKRIGIKLKSLQQTVSIANPNQYEFSATVKASTEWLVAPSEISVDGYETIKFPISVNIEKLKPGRNFCELVVSDKRIPVWTWYRIVNETALTLAQDAPNIHHIEEFSGQEKPTPIEVLSTDEPYQSFSIFEDVDFEFPLASETSIGYLVGDFNQWAPRTLFLEKRDGSIGTTLSMTDGTYLFRAEIDGEMRLSPCHLNEIVCCAHGLASRTQIERREQKITLQNSSRRRLKLQLRSSTEWLQVASEPISLPANRKRDVPIVLLPEALQPGLNLGWIEIETVSGVKSSLRSPIFVMGITHGAVPVLRNTELTFPEFEQGKPVDIPLPLDVVGRGELKGNIQPAAVLRFTNEDDLRIQNEAAFEPMEVAPFVRVLSGNPSNVHRKQCKALLVTNCYLANRRVLPFIAKYDITHLISEPPTLYFPKVFLFDEPQHADITVRRSDNGRVVKCTVEIPQELAQTGLLKVKDMINENKINRCEFVLNPAAVDAAGRFTGNLCLRDEKSGMTLPIKFGTDIIESRMDIHIENPTQRLHQSDEIPIIITNVGESDLRIFEVRFAAGNFYLTPPPAPNLTLSAGESLKLIVSVRKQAGFFYRTVLKDTLIIKSNDSQFRKGVFKKELTAEIQGRFWNFG